MIPLRDNVVGDRTPYVAYVFIGLNVLAFLYELVAPVEATLVELGQQRLLLDSSLDVTVWRYGLRPLELLNPGLALPPATPIPEWGTLFTSMFLHGGFLHIGGNMLYMWIFADNVEDAMGHVRFAIFYLLAGLVAAGVQVLSDPGSPIPMVGASGAVAGVMGAYLVLYPRARVLTAVIIIYFIRLVEIPAVILLGVWIFLQVIQAPVGGGVAFFAHIGGFVFGMIMARLLATHRHQARVHVRQGANLSDYFRR